MITEVEELTAELQGHSERMVEDERDRLLAQERLFYNRSLKLM